MRDCHDPERLEAMKAMLAQGCTVRDIAVAFGLTRSGVVNYLVRHNVMFRKTKRKPGVRKPEMLEAMRRLYEEKHFSMRLVALHFGVTEETVYYYFKRYGVPRRKGCQIKGVSREEHQRRFRRAMAGVLGE